MLTVIPICSLQDIPVTPGGGGRGCLKRDVTTTCPACLHPTPKEVTLQGCLPPAATWTCDPPARATGTKPERNPEAAVSLLGRHTQSGAVLGVGKLRHVRLACSHQAVCSNTKRNTSPSILDASNMQNIKRALFPDLGVPPVKTGGCWAPSPARGVLKALLPAQ